MEQNDLMVDAMVIVVVVSIKVHVETACLVDG
jgi:hypothetical protein